jgi:hypothetical protein
MLGLGYPLLVGHLMCNTCPQRLILFCVNGRQLSRKGPLLSHVPAGTLRNSTPWMRSSCRCARANSRMDHYYRMSLQGHCEITLPGMRSNRRCAALLSALDRYIWMSLQGHCKSYSVARVETAYYIPMSLQEHSKLGTGPTSF